MKLATSAKAGKPAHEELRKRLDALRKGQVPEATAPAKEGEGEDRRKAVGASTFEEQLFQLNSGRRIPALDGGLDEYLLKAQQDGLRDAEAIKKRSAEAGIPPKARGNIGSQLALQASAREKRPSPPRGGVPGSRGGKKKKKKKKKFWEEEEGPKEIQEAPRKRRRTRRQQPEFEQQQWFRQQEQQLIFRSELKRGVLAPAIAEEVPEGSGVSFEAADQASRRTTLRTPGFGCSQPGFAGGNEAGQLLSSYDESWRPTGEQPRRSRTLPAGQLDRFTSNGPVGFVRRRISFEIFTPEVMTAAGASMTLEARRHARLVDKAKGIQSSRSRNEGPYSGGAWRGSSWNSNPWDGYGDSAKGKGKKGKGKPKGGSGQGKGGGSWRGGSAWEPAGKGGSEKDKNPEKEKEVK